MLGHLEDHVAVVELGDLLTERRKGGDEEETAADRYALQLLTGMPEPQIVPQGSGFNAPSLADAALRNAEKLHIEPGVIALCFGHSTGAWQRVFSALKMIYAHPSPVWVAINNFAFQQLNWTDLSDDTKHFLTIVLGEKGVTTTTLDNDLLIKGASYWLLGIPGGELLEYQNSSRG